MRNIRRIIVHCSATKPSMDIGADLIRQWHKLRGFSDVGYHYIIRRNGAIETGRDHETAGAHAKGHNHDSLGICLVGGVKSPWKKPDANFTFIQYFQLVDLVQRLKARYHIQDSAIMGHRDLPGVTKACPCFDVRELLARR